MCINPDSMILAQEFCSRLKHPAFLIHPCPPSHPSPPPQTPTTVLIVFCSIILVYDSLFASL